MLIGAPADTSLHLARSRVRQRELLDSSRKLSSGNKFTGQAGAVSDGGALRFSSGLNARLKTQSAAIGNVQHAYAYVNTQAEGLRTAEQIVKRMEQIAYEATDPILTDHDRSNLDLEFTGLKQALQGLSLEEQFGSRLFDPYAAHYEDRFPVLGVSDGGWETQEQVVDIGAKRGKIHLWWNPTWQSDSLKVYHGPDLLFDSGEYRTNHWTNFPNQPATGPSGSDYFTVEFGSAVKNLTEGAGNQGVSFHDKDLEVDFPANTTQAELDWYAANGFDYKQYQTNEDYPKAFGTAYGETEIKFVVNEKEAQPAGFPFPRQAGSSTVWEYYAEIEKSNLTDQSVLVDSEGGTMELRATGFSTLSHLTVKDARLAAASLDALDEELGNLRYQMGVLAGEIAEFETRVDVLQGKLFEEKKALARITSVDVAAETTRLAKNQLLDSMTNRALLHSRLSAERVFNLLV